MVKKKSDFILFCEGAAEIVKTWPHWKQNLLGSNDTTKPDGRRNTIGCAFPYRMTNAAKARTIEAFEKRGCSTHSIMGMTLGVLLEHCHKNQINFRLTKVDHGYWLRKT